MFIDEGSITSVDIHMPVGLAPVIKRPFHYRECPWQNKGKNACNAGNDLIRQEDLLTCT